MPIPADENVNSLEFEKLKIELYETIGMMNF